MLKRIFITLLLGFAALAATAGPNVPATIKLCANHWEPFTGADLPNQGVATEIVVTALTRAGYQVEVSFMPWSRALTQAYYGQSDGVVGIWATRQRHERLLFSDSYMDNALYLVYLRPELSANAGIDKLAGMRIGVGRDYDYSDGFLERNRKQLEPVDRIKQNLLKLQLGRIDMMLEDKYAVQYMVGRYPGEYRALPPLKYSADPVLKLPLHFGIRRDHPQANDIIAAFNLQLKTMKKDGSLAAILRKLE
ncbi:transporter substrate-binding domain-containing protein [Pseudoduganella sp. FT55W]|uniref:Transporter substrate-binding domain-containing protein n=1 Tax=Duganella rivi TaxID=2666083 RepID=A0A7X4GPG9_9BURK|nr:transporter substrate-binding domain-containing protein [Duganella rivi]MYM66706.1 transporter substrate-binding domain-containing protein [Duganella rivi]